MLSPDLGCRRRALVIDQAADFELRSRRPLPGIVTQDRTERMLRIDPPPFVEIFGAKARITESVPKKLVSISKRICASSPLRRSTAGEEPALLMEKVDIAEAASAAATDAGSVMSRATTLAPGRSTVSGVAELRRTPWRRG